MSFCCERLQILGLHLADEINEILLLISVSFYVSLLFCTVKTEIIVSRYCSRDRNGLSKQSSDIVNCSILLQGTLLKLGLCSEQ